MANGRSIDRLAQRVASVTSARPARRNAQMAMRSAAMTLGPGSGSDLRFVLLVKGVAQPVKRLNRPLPADVGGQAGGAGAVRGGAGHAERGYCGDRVAVQVSDVPFDQVHLADVRERQVLRRGQHLDGAGGDPAMAAVGG